MTNIIRFVDTDIFKIVSFDTGEQRADYFNNHNYETIWSVKIQDDAIYTLARGNNND